MSSTVAPVVSYLEATLGLSFSGPRRTRLLAAVEAERVAARLAPDAFRSAASRPGPLFDRLVAQVTVGETYFFRDRQQCQLLRSVVFPQLARTITPGQRIAVWSAGCASGEEAVTLAALAEEAGLGQSASVVGSDVSRRAIAKAQSGVYGRWSMRSTTDEEKAAYFHVQDGSFTVSERLRRRTDFYQRNLLDGPPPPGRFDVVVCRNLLIYLTRDAVRRVTAVLTDGLTADGWLVTAAGDPPLLDSGLVRLRTPFGSVYRRADAAAPVPSWADAAATARQPSMRKRSDDGRVRRMHRPSVPAFSAPALLPPVSPATVASSAPAQAERLRSLGDAGRLAEACAAAETALEAHPLDVELRYLAGTLLLEAGRLESASTAAAAAVYLQPDEPAAHLLLGQIHHAAGELDRARRSFRNAARLLAATPGEEPVALAAGMPAGHLAAVVQRYLDALATTAERR